MCDMYVHKPTPAQVAQVSSIDQKSVIRRAACAFACLAVLSACSPGGVVAGTIGAAGAVAGTAVDVVLRNAHSHEVLE